MRKTNRFNPPPDPFVFRSGNVECRRNLSGEIFPGRCPAERLPIICDRICAAASKIRGKYCRGGRAVKAGDGLRHNNTFGVLEALGFLTSGPEWERDGVLMYEFDCADTDVKAGMSVNIGDHIALYVSSPDPDKAMKTTTGIMTALAKKLDFATDAEFGALTSDPVFSGLGTRVSFDLCLSGLNLCGDTDRVLNAADRLYFAVGPAWRDRENDKSGYEAPGYVERFSCVLPANGSNAQFTGLYEFCREVEKQEKAARTRFLLANPFRAIDYVTRAYGIASEACVIDEFDVHDIVSSMEFGVAMGLACFREEPVPFFFRRIEEEFLNFRVEQPLPDHAAGAECLRDRRRAEEFFAALGLLSVCSNPDLWVAKMLSCFHKPDAGTAGGPPENVA